MKPHQRFLSTLLVLASLIAFAACPFNNISSQAPATDRLQDEFVQLETSAPPAPSNVEYEDTSYNIHYRLVEYEKVFTFSPTVAFGNIVGISLFHMNNGHTYRVIGFKNGTIQVANITNYGVPFYPSEPFITKGYDWQLLPSFKLDTSTFEPQKMFTEASIYSPRVAIAGMNKTNNELAIYLLQYDEATSTFFYFSNYSIPNPSGFSAINDLDVVDGYCDWSENLVVSGRYLNGTTSVPFGYRIDWFTKTILFDLTNITTSTTDYAFYGSVIWGIRSSSGGATLVVTTNKIVSVYGKTVIKWISATGIPISTYMVYNVGKGLESNQVFLLPYCFWDVISGTQGTFLVSYNVTDYNFEVRQDPASVALCNEVVYTDTIIKATSDLADGVVFIGSDTNFKVWQDWVLGTGSIGGPFDFYLPIRIINIDVGNDNGCFEIWFGDQRGMWYALFNKDDVNVLGVGNSSVNKVVTQRMDVYHARGTNQFTFSVSGYLERNDSELVEVGIVPLYAKPTLYYADAGVMFSTERSYRFLNSETGGIILRPSRAFIGTGSKITEFQCNFDADFCPVAYEFFTGFRMVALQVQYLVYEKYSNGTYTQKLCRTVFDAKSIIVMFSYQLETSISIQDSHMLDELRVLADGIEYNPYSLTFINPDMNLHVIDKITNQTLFNDTVRFQDPLLLPIPAKYEFSLRYFSAIDFFGLDYGLVNTYVNGTEVTTDTIRVLSPTARIVTTDFANSTISDVTVKKNVDGLYIKLALPIATVIVSNNYNYTIIFYMIKNAVSISYSIPSLASVILRLATGHYRYMITDTDGNEIMDKEIDFASSTSIAVGELTFSFPVDPTIQARTEINIMIAVIGIAAIAATGIVIANAFVKRKGKVNRRPWG